MMMDDLTPPRETMSGARWKKVAGDGVVYALVDPRNDQIRYIGATMTSLSQRLAGHLGATKAILYPWIKELKNLGLRPAIRIVQEAPTAELGAAEWKAIREHFLAGWWLLNVEARPWETSIEVAELRLINARHLGPQIVAQAEAELAAAKAWRIRHDEMEREEAERERRYNPSDPKEFAAAALATMDLFLDENHPQYPDLETRELTAAIIADFARVGQSYGIDFRQVVQSQVRRAALSFAEHIMMVRQEQQQRAA